MKKYNIPFLIILIFAVLGLFGCGGSNPMGPTPTNPSSPVPTISGISPASGAVGTIVTITGTNFTPVAANNVVKFNGVQAIVASATATVIVTSVPPNASTGAITVTTSGGTATSTIFTVIKTFQVAAIDQFGNVAKGYQGTIKFFSSDLLALLPTNYTFTITDLGVANFSIFFATVGTQTLTVTDTINTMITGSTSVIVK
jgi:hypothetical protein